MTVTIFKTQNYNQNPLAMTQCVALRKATGELEYTYKMWNTR